jgi:biotin carboxylase
MSKTAMRPRILLVDSGFSGLTNYLRDHNYDYIILKDRASTKYPDKEIAGRVVCDFSDLDAVLKAVDTLPKIDGVITIYDRCIILASQIASHLGLPALPLGAAQACTDKTLMRELFAKAPKQISPDFAEVHSEADVRAFAATHEFPLIIKPANLSKSLLVTKNDSLDQLLENYQRTVSQIEAVYAKYAPHTAPKILVEEFLVGFNHSVDAFVDTDGVPHVLEQVVDYEIGHEIGFDDNFQYSRTLPSRLSAEDQAALRECAALGIQALGIKNSPAHTEIIITKKGPRIVEIGARNGGYRERMHGVANGIDILGAALSLALGQPPHITATKNESISVLELFPKVPGDFVGITNEESLRALPSFSELRVKAKPGAFVGKAADGFKMCAIIELHHPDADQVKKDMAYILAHVSVETK